ncbi:hypothetical protein IFE17_02730 [Actinobacillus sp. GY-402]|nr:hypothetical protein IFE17_02730 [Actinobacillus sp. GY-402]
MEIQINGMMIFNGLISIAVFFIGLWFKSLQGTITEIEDEIKDVKRSYQSKELAQHESRSLQRQLDEILSNVKRINEKLDSKADK